MRDHYLILQLGYVLLRIHKIWLENMGCMGLILLKNKLQKHMRRLLLLRSQCFVLMELLYVWVPILLAKTQITP